MASYPASKTYRPDDSGSDFFLKVAAVLLGIAVSALVVFSVVVGHAAHEARDQARAPT